MPVREMFLFKIVNVHWRRKEKDPLAVEFYDRSA